jgi:hypothetical protein
MRCKPVKEIPGLIIAHHHFSSSFLIPLQPSLINLPELWKNP